ncbi:MAG: hypothetical protein ACRD5B_04195 [Nitrososphaeraceae archaeon]
MFPIKIFITKEVLLDFLRLCFHCYLSPNSIWFENKSIIAGGTLFAEPLKTKRLKLISKLYVLKQLWQKDRDCTNYILVVLNALLPFMTRLKAYSSLASNHSFMLGGDSKRENKRD